MANEQQLVTIFKKRRGITALIYWVGGISLIIAINGSADTLTLSQAIERALSANPSIASKRANADALAQMPDQVGTLPDPRFSFNLANLPLDSFSFNQTPMTQIQFGLSQVVPYPGKLALRRQSATLQAQAGSAQVLDTEQQLIRHVKHQWWQLFYWDHAIETLKHNHQLMQQLIDVAQTKYTVGQGRQQDVLLAQVELSRLIDSEQQLQTLRYKTQVRFARLLGRDEASLAKMSLAMELPEPIETLLPEIDAVGVLVTQANQVHQALQMRRYQAQAAKTRLALAKKNAYPDFKFGAVYGWRDDEADFASVKVSMNLPIYVEKRQRRQQDQRNHEWLEQKYAVDDLRQSIAETIILAHADYQRAKTQAQLYQETIIPQAKQTVEAMLVGYQVNQIDFLSLLRSQMTLFNYETQYWQAFSQAQQSIAALNAAVGKEVIQ